MRYALLAFVLMPLAGCGDPVVILGDQPGIMRVVVGVPADQGAGEGTPATNEALSTPRGLDVDQDGVLYVADHRARRILAVASNGALDVVVDHRACGGSLCMERPEQIALDREGSLVVADPLGGRVWRVGLVDGSTSVVAGLPGGEEPAPGVEAASAELGSPTGVAVSPEGLVFFSDQESHRVWSVSRSGLLEPVAGTGQSGGEGDGGPAASARLFLPGSLSMAQDRLYIADRGNHKVRVVNLGTGVIETVAGTGVPAFSGDGGPARNASLRFPDGVTVTPDGATLYIADTGNNRVRSVNLGSRVIRTFAGTGDSIFVGSGLEAGETNLDSPTGLAVASLSLLFISDSGHQLVWRTPVRF